MMGDFILIYDSNHSETTDIALNRAPEVGAKAIGVASVDQLQTELTQLKNSGVKINQLLFYTHGEPGTIFFGKSALISTRVLSEFVGNGLEDLFLPDARINFDGCNVAAVKRGCEVGKNCSNTDNGTVFLMSIAKTFLFKGGGRTTGWTSTGVGFPSLGGSVIHHLTGTGVHVFINKGGSRTRLAVGRTEWPNPSGRWEVEKDTRNAFTGVVSKQIFYYLFDAPDKIGWTDRSKYHAGVSTPMGKGTWRMGSDGLQIAWETGMTETWDVPLFVEYQTGTAAGTMGIDFSVVARMVPRNF